MYLLREREVVVPHECSKRCAHIGTHEGDDVVALRRLAIPEQSRQRSRIELDPHPFLRRRKTNFPRYGLYADVDEPGGNAQRTQLLRFRK